MGTQGLLLLAANVGFALWGGEGSTLKTKSTWNENPQGAFGYGSHDSELSTQRLRIRAQNQHSGGNSHQGPGRPTRNLSGYRNALSAS